MESTLPLPTAVEDVILRDGRTLRLRPPSDADVDGVVAFLESLSPESRHYRFHGARTVDAGLVQPLLGHDWQERGSYLAELADAEGVPRVVALAGYVRLRDRARAEVAFAVADELQGHGVGTRLLERLAARAAANGIDTFVAEVLLDNRAMLRVFADAGFEIERSYDGGTTEVTLSLEPSERVVERADERDHAGVVASLRPVFEPRSVVVVGASARRGTIGGELFRNILAADFAGAVYPVNRSGEAVGGVAGYVSVEDVPGEIDLAVICVPGPTVLEAAEQALRRGVRALCVISAGFAEIGAEGAARQERLLALVRAHGVRLVGPNCLGIASSAVRLNATFARRALPAGTIGFSSQSGALGLALLEQAQARGLGFSSFVSIGNKADVSSNDLLEWWIDDDRTDVVLLYLESFGNPRKFSRVARRLARAKPVLAMRSGTSGAGARAARSHTAALAGSDAAVDALFRQAGVLRVGTLEELLDAATFFSTQPLPEGNRVAVLTNAGGLGILCADACEAAGLTLPGLTDATRARLREVLPVEASVANPIDLLGSATAAQYAAALPIVLADPNIDAAIAQFVPPVVATTEDVSAAIQAGAAGSGKPVLTVLIDDGPAVPGCFGFPEAAAHALGLAARRAAWLRRPLGTPLPVEGVDRAGARGLVAEALAETDDLWLDPVRTRALLSLYGIRLVEERVAETPGEAVDAALALGLPAVVKTAAAGAHKSESGGVALDLRSAEDVRAAAERIGGPVLVQPFLRGYPELLAGVVQDPVFGPLVAFGAGGIYAELIGDAGFALAPLTDADARELVEGGKAGRLVSGFRGLPPADIPALTDLAARLGRLAEDVPEVAELDLNPVLGLPDSCVAVDARVRVRRADARPPVKAW